MPWRCTNNRCSRINNVANPGRTATWNPKKRVSVAPGHLFAAAKEDHHRLADDGNLPSNLGANLGGEESQVFHGSK